MSELLEKNKISIDNKIIQTSIGVPQGAVMSPTLFNLYINDLWDVLPNKVEMFAFADDIAIILEGEDKLDQTLTILEGYCKANELSINKEKSGIMIPRVDERTKIPSKFSHMIYKNYPIVTQYTYLGVIIDDNFRFKEELESKRQKEKSLKKMEFILKDQSINPMSKYHLWQALFKSRLWY